MFNRSLIIPPILHLHFLATLLHYSVIMLLKMFHIWKKNFDTLYVENSSRGFKDCHRFICN